MSWDTAADLYVSPSLSVLTHGPDLCPDHPYFVKEGTIHYRLTPAVWVWLSKAMKKAEQAWKDGTLQMPAADWDEVYGTFQALGQWTAKRYPVEELRAAWVGTGPLLHAVGESGYSQEAEQALNAYRPDFSDGPVQLVGVAVLTGSDGWTLAVPQEELKALEAWAERVHAARPDKPGVAVTPAVIRPRPEGGGKTLFDGATESGNSSGA